MKRTNEGKTDGVKTRLRSVVSKNLNWDRQERARYSWTHGQLKRCLINGSTHSFCVE